jgi:serine/threonine protein kinase
VEAFRRLQQYGHTSGIIGFHGSFTRGDTHNVLLEFADKGTLEDYFRTQIPPVDPEDIINFWQALFKILDALRHIHQLDGTGGPLIFHGYVTPPRHVPAPANLFPLQGGTKT